MQETIKVLQAGLLVLDQNSWNHITEYKQMNTGSYKNCYLHTIRL